MKKLLFLIPIALWILSYFAWTYSGQFIDSEMTAKGLWWLATNVFLGFGFIGSSFYAIWKNDD